MRIQFLCVVFFLIASLPAAATPVTNLVISEVLYDASGGDNGREWVELYNGTSDSIDLSTWSLGWGGSSYASALLGLSGVIGAADYFVFGGPTSSAANGSPVFDWIANFSPDLQNAGRVADGLALFDLAPAVIDASTLPVFSVVYGGANSNGLIRPDGSVGLPDVGDASGGDSIEYLGGGDWRIQANPTPGRGPLVAASGVPTPVVSVPEPGMWGLLLVGLAGWRMAGARPRPRRAM